MSGVRLGGDAHTRVLVAALQAQRRHWHWLLLGLGLPLLVPLVFGALQAWRGQPVWPVMHPLLVFMVGLPALAALWGLLVSNLAVQNLPSAARLVPDHPNTLRRVLLGSWAVFTLLVAALLASLFGHPLVNAVVAGAELVLIALATRRPPLWALQGVLVLVLTNQGLREQVQTLLAGLWQAAPWLMAALVLAPAGVLLSTLVGPGDGAHGQRHLQRLERQRAILGPDAGHGEQSSATQALGRERGLHWLAHRLYHWHFGRRVARAGQPGHRPGPAWPRLMMGLGPMLYPTTLLSHTLIGVAIMLVIVLLTTWLMPFTEGHGLLHDGLLLPLLLAMMQAQFLVAGPALRRTRREQALLRLVPGAPGTAQLNRALGRSWAGQQLLLLAAAVLLGLALCALLDPQGLAHLGALRPLAYAALALPFGPLLLWRDWARVPVQDGLYLLVLLALAAAELALAAAAWWAFGLLGGAGDAAGAAPAGGGLLVAQRWPLALLASGLIVSAALLPWLWRRLMRAPVAWPGGRLA